MCFQQPTPLCCQRPPLSLLLKTCSFWQYDTNACTRTYNDTYSFSAWCSIAPTCWDEQGWRVEVTHPTSSVDESSARALHISGTAVGSYLLSSRFYRACTGMWKSGLIFDSSVCLLVRQFFSLGHLQYNGQMCSSLSLFFHILRLTFDVLSTTHTPVLSKAPLSPLLKTCSFWQYDTNACTHTYNDTYSFSARYFIAPTCWDEQGWRV